MAPLARGLQVSRAVAIGPESFCGLEADSAISAELFSGLNRGGAGRARKFETLSAFDAEMLVGKINFAAIATGDRRHSVSLPRSADPAATQHHTGAPLVGEVTMSAAQTVNETFYQSSQGEQMRPVSRARGAELSIAIGRQERT
jgi:hypothetical protein